VTRKVPIVVGIGEVLWDRFPQGDLLGGAPANFAFHAGQLGAAGRIVSRLGRDADGDRLAAELSAQGVSIDYLQRDDKFPTGTVLVQLKDGQPSYEISTPVAWDYLEWTPQLEELARQTDGVSFGTLSQRNAASRATIQTFLQHTPRNTVRLFDINLRQSFWSREVIEEGLKQTTVLKLNEHELPMLSKLLGTADDGRKFSAQMRSDYGIQTVALTLGEQGCVLYGNGEEIISKPPPIEFKDAVGAGDAFSAALMLGLLRGDSLRDIADRANRVGAYVASQAGAMPKLPGTFVTL
jgi:fructokinase